MDSQDGSIHDVTPSVPSCYPTSLNNTSLRDKFRNVDDSDQLSECQRHLQNEDAKNFIVDFGAEEAWCAVDLNDSEFSAVLGSGSKPLETRWINIWAPERQKETIKALTTHYGISTRLRGMMSSDPTAMKKSSPKTAPCRPSMQVQKDATNEKSPFADINEVENGRNPNLMHTQSSGPTQLDAPGLSPISFSQIINHIWHFVSVDFGPRYICIGYNSVYAVRGVDFANPSSMPKGKRLWAWLVLCDDGTVISIQENPFPPSTSFTPDKKKESLKVIRRHVSLIFSSISKQHDPSQNANPLMTIQVRNFPASSGAACIKPGEGPGLLLYYIFDDWMSSYSLLMEQEQHPYRIALEELRKSMLQRAKVKLIDELHRIGRQLAVLKRIYQSYELILHHILKRQRRLRDENRNSMQNMQSTRRRATGTRHDTWRTVTYDDWDPTALGGIELSSAALARFERLIDRIRLLALSEIDECLAEKKALTFLVFNLIAMKDSQAVERLTRITVLLAMVTIPFLSVSLTTAYFSTEVDELQHYTAKTYWVTFAVVMLLSIVLLMLFSWLSGTVEGRPVYRSIATTLYDSSMRALGRKAGRADEEEE